MFWQGQGVESMMTHQRHQSRTRLLLATTMPTERQLVFFAATWDCSCKLCINLMHQTHLDIGMVLEIFGFDKLQAFAGEQIDSQVLHWSHNTCTHASAHASFLHMNGMILLVRVSFARACSKEEESKKASLPPVVAGLRVIGALLLWSCSLASGSEVAALRVNTSRRMKRMRFSCHGLI